MQVLGPDRDVAGFPASLRKAGILRFPDRGAGFAEILPPLSGKALCS